jgi:hypothetical protein
MMVILQDFPVLVLLKKEKILILSSLENDSKLLFDFDNTLLSLTVYLFIIK